LKTDDSLTSIEEVVNNDNKIDFSSKFQDFLSVFLISIIAYNSVQIALIYYAKLSADTPL
jgi:hypothetical protein